MQIQEGEDDLANHLDSPENGQSASEPKSEIGKSTTRLTVGDRLLSSRSSNFVTCEPDCVLVSRIGLIY